MSDGAVTLPHIPIRPMRGLVLVLLDAPDAALAPGSCIVAPDNWQPTTGTVLRVGAEDTPPHGLKEGDRVHVGKWNGWPLDVAIARRYGFEPMSNVDGASSRLFFVRPLANGKGDGDHVNGVLET